MGLIPQSQRLMSARPLSLVLPFIRDFANQIWEGTQLLDVWHSVPMVFLSPSVSFNAPFSGGSREIYNLPIVRVGDWKHFSEFRIGSLLV